MISVHPRKNTTLTHFSNLVLTLNPLVSQNEHCRVKRVILHSPLLQNLILKYFIFIYSMYFIGNYAHKIGHDYIFFSAYRHCLGYNVFKYRYTKVASISTRNIGSIKLFFENESPGTKAQLKCVYAN